MTSWEVAFYFHAQTWALAVCDNACVCVCVASANKARRLLAWMYFGDQSQRAFAVACVSAGLLARERLLYVRFEPQSKSHC